MRSVDEAGSAMSATGMLGSHRGGGASRLPGSAIFDNLFFRVSAVVGRHSCEKGK
jgi:hypothetical protein